MKKFINLQFLASKIFTHRLKKQLLKEVFRFRQTATLIYRKMKKRLSTMPRKTLLFNKQQAWIKKESGLFDVTMGTYDGSGSM